MHVLSTYLFIKVHEEHYLVFYGGEEVVFVDELIDIFVSQSQVDLQGPVITLVIRVAAWTSKRQHIGN